jgi:hypothetical protein
MDAIEPTPIDIARLPFEAVERKTSQGNEPGPGLAENGGALEMLIK